MHANPVVSMLAQSSKALTTKDWQVSFFDEARRPLDLIEYILQYAREEYKQLKLLRTIDALKSDHVWSFTQQKRFVPPARPKAHWDLLLDEMVALLVPFTLMSASSLTLSFYRNGFGRISGKKRDGGWQWLIIWLYG